MGCDIVKDKERHQLADVHGRHEGVSPNLEYDWPPKEHQKGKSGLKREQENEERRGRKTKGEKYHTSQSHPCLIAFP